MSKMLMTNFQPWEKTLKTNRKAGAGTIKGRSTVINTHHGPHDVQHGTFSTTDHETFTFIKRPRELRAHKITFLAN